MDHLWLIGMMGTGKTTVGAMVAERLSLPLVDTDAAVMEQSGKTIPELFAESESTFRRWESQAVTTIASGQRSVVSTGGGAILDPNNVETMRRTGTTILLTAELAELGRRLQSDTLAERPLHGGAESLERLTDDRMATYVESADHVVDTTERTPAEAANEVLLCVAM
ncbi:MAG: shikimate kinase [Acidimicrobiia bacterium]